MYHYFGDRNTSNRLNRWVRIIRFNPCFSFVSVFNPHHLGGISKEEKVMVKQELYKLLYEWFITETCEDCQHISTFRDGDNRHPCNRCECYEKFRIDDRMKEDLKEKVKRIINVVNGKEE